MRKHKRKRKCRQTGAKSGVDQREILKCRTKQLNARAKASGEEFSQSQRSLNRVEKRKQTKRSRDQFTLCIFKIKFGWNQIKNINFQKQMALLLSWKLQKWMMIIPRQWAPLRWSHRKEISRCRLRISNNNYSFWSVKANTGSTVWTEEFWSTVQTKEPEPKWPSSRKSCWYWIKPDLA